MASPARRRTSSTSSGFRRSTSSASPSAAGWHRSSPCGTRTGCDGWSSPRRPAGSAAFPAHRSRSGCSPRRCGTTRLASCRRPPAGCTDLSRTRTGGSCTSRCTLAVHDLRRCGDTRASSARSPAGRASRGCTASPRRRSSSPAGRTRSSRRSMRGSSARASPTRRFTSFPTPATCCSWTMPSESAELITCFLRSDETHT